MKKKINNLKSFFIFLSLLFTALFSKAQWYDPNKVNPKAVDIYLQSTDAVDQGNYKDALIDMNKALKIDPKYLGVYLSRAAVYATLKDYTSSIADFEKAIALDPVYSATFLLSYSISLAGGGEFQKALNAVDTFLMIPNINQYSIKAANYRKTTYEFALDYESKHPDKNYLFAPENLGDSINTNVSEYYPSITIDGNKLIFTRRVGDQDEDFYQSDNIKGKWSRAVPLSGNVNTTFNEGAQNISQDGQMIVFAGCNYPEGFGSCDLYSSYKNNKDWSDPSNLGPIVNTDEKETSPSLSPDKRDLYFSSNRLGGYGGMDIG
ncbi:MAG: hypothetical protein WDM71_10495 [Ferruginibacter sp.]